MSAPDSPVSSPSAVEIQWTVYADHYDAMCSVNPSYHSMLDLVVDKIQNLNRPQPFKLLDVGAGTGNLLLRLAAEYPSSTFLHLDMDAGMVAKAKEKYESHSIRNVELVQSPFLEWAAPEGTFDIIISTNALYSINPHQAALKRMYDLLTPSGTMVLVDFGRKQNTNDWLFYIVRNSIRNHGWLRTYQIVKDNWEAARQNRRTTAAQTGGSYWLHSNEQFALALKNAQFEILETQECYRGYSDIAVCIKSSQ